nr:MAG TPA: hypothetical protein [Herelleviridae sp.]
MSNLVLIFKITFGNLLLGPAENRIYSTFCQKQTPPLFVILHKAL